MKTKTILLVAISALSVIAFLTGCGGSGGTKELISNRWVLERIEHSDSTGAITIPQNIYIEFSDSSMVYGRAGCNNFFSRYQADDNGKMTLTNPGSTMMWCPNMPFEDAYLKMITDVAEFRATSSELKLIGQKYTLYYKPENN